MCIRDRDGNNGDGGSAEQEPVTIDDNQTPLAGGIGQASWALLNLLLAIATGIIMIVLLAGYFIGRKKDVYKRQVLPGDGAQAGHTSRNEFVRQYGQRGIVKEVCLRFGAPHLDAFAAGPGEGTKSQLVKEGLDVYKRQL